MRDVSSVSVWLAFEASRPLSPRKGTRCARNIMHRRRETARSAEEATSKRPRAAKDECSSCVSLVLLLEASSSTPRTSQSPVVSGLSTLFGQRAGRNSETAYRTPSLATAIRHGETRVRVEYAKMRNRRISDVSRIDCDDATNKRCRLREPVRSRVENFGFTLTLRIRSSSLKGQRRCNIVQVVVLHLCCKCSLISIL